jgi:regulator of protease activity HflC (stomatin/prohibitin superfamily)
MATIPTMSCFCFGCIREKTVGIVENCGQFSRPVNPGFICIMCPFESIRAVVSLRVQQLDCICETKTKDNVFVKVAVSVQYQVLPAKVDVAYYKLTDPVAQIKYKYILIHSILNYLIKLI